MDTAYAHARYRELLYRHGHGYPFWIPELSANLPEDQRVEGLRLGDVGILTDDGGFDYLWNIHLPAIHPHNRLAPPNFEPIACDIRDVRTTDLYFPPNTTINSTFVKKREINVEAELEPATFGGFASGVAGFEFAAEGNSGAVLALPRGGVRSDSLKLSLYLRHATENAECWYRHINQELHRGVKSGALYVVTGTDKCSSWGVASFANPSGSHGLTLKFIAADVASSSVSVNNSWSANFGAEHRAKVVDRSELSQCVFSRGFVIYVRDNFFAQICGMQVKVTALDGSLGRPPFVSSNRPYNRYSDLNANINIRRLPDSQLQKSVAALIGEELLNQNDNAVIAIVHDNDWIASTQSGDLLQRADSSASFLEDLVYHATTHSRTVIFDGVCTFVNANVETPSGGGSLGLLPSDLHVPSSSSQTASTMPLNYSKWDELEISDDSDIEGHPKVDHKSLVRWKQRDIHEKRDARKPRIAQLRAEIDCNNVILPKLDDALAGTQKGGPEFFSALVERLKTNPSPDKPATTSPNQPTYDAMLEASLIKIFGDLKEKGIDKSDSNFNDKLVKAIREHIDEFKAHNEHIQQELETELAEQKKKITSDDIHEGFESHYVPPKPAPAPLVPPKKTVKKAETKFEVLNPAAAASSSPTPLIPQAPTQSITFNVPDGPPPAELRLEGEGTEDLDIEEVRKVLQMRWDIFRGFPEDMQKALQSQKLERVNKVLGAMSVDDAESIVESLQLTGILSFADEGRIRDATADDPPLAE